MITSRLTILFTVSILITFLNSCFQNGDEKSITNTLNADKVEHFFDSTSNKYFKVQTHDSEISLFSYDLSDTVLNRENFSKNRQDSIDNIERLRKNIIKIDSNSFYKRLIAIFDAKQFDLSKDWKSIDQTYLVVKPNPVEFPIHRIAINAKEFPRNMTASLFFKIVVDNFGKITQVQYDGWKNQPKELIENVSKELKSKTIQPYTILHKPIKVSVPVKVVLVD